MPFHAQCGVSNFESGAVDNAEEHAFDCFKASGHTPEDLHSLKVKRAHELAELDTY
jgi:hypothetical protein